MSEHTKGLLRVGRSGAVVADHPVPEMSGSDAVEYYGGHLVAESVTAANARRLVACWNACHGLPTDELEQKGLADGMVAMADRCKLLTDLLREARNPLITAMDASSEDESTAIEELIDLVDELLAGKLPDHIADVSKMVAPEGWQLVPVEPTFAMLAADGCKEHHEGQECTFHKNRRRIWAAMLAAAPKHQGGEPCALESRSSSKD